ncbi:MAG: DUF6531 domain-containing protein [Gammaproteobacteria bacterium]|nr:DUF6531 domain-containing protein [Gammaproteobacteria bacterium]
MTQDQEVLPDYVSRLLNKPAEAAADYFSDSAQKVLDRPQQKFLLTSSAPAQLRNGFVALANHRTVTRGCPISVVSGEELLTQSDFQLPGPLALNWQRTYRSSNDRDVGLGVGWSSPWFAYLIEEQDRVIFHSGEGREITFTRPQNGSGCRHTLESLTLYHEGTEYRLVNEAGESSRFAGAKKRKRLEQVSNGNGFYIRLNYSDTNRLSSIKDSVGRRLRLEYNINGHLRLVHLVNAEGETQGQPLVQYRYSNQSDLVMVIDAAGNNQEYKYQDHLLVQRTTKDGFNYYFEWDEYSIHGKCVRNWGDRNIYAYEFTYDVEQCVSRCTDGRGYTTEYHYNELGLVTKEISPLGATTSWEYDDCARLLSETDPEGAVSRYEYDDQGRLVCEVDALGHITRYEYDDNGLLLCTTTPDGCHWRREYDLQSNLIAEIGPDGNATRYRYDNSGNILSVIDARGNETTYEWNKRSELACQYDPQGRCTEYTYDELGRVIRVVQDKNRATQYKYDAAGNVVFIIQPDGSNCQMLYTAEGYLTHYIDPLGRTTRFRYDGLSQPAERIDPNGLRLRYIYDPERNLIALLNQNNDRYELRYDADQRLVMEIGFDGRVQKYQYNKAGYPLSHTDGSYRYIEFDRDALGRLLRMESSSGSWTEVDYDVMGRICRALNNDSEVRISYDAYGRIRDEMQNGRRIQYRYDTVGNRTHMVLPDGQVIYFVYDAAGHYTCASYMSRLGAYKAKTIAKVVRNGLGKETKRQVGKNSSAWFAYDPMGRLVRQKLSVDYQPLYLRAYRYNKAGNLTRLDDSQRGTTQYRYDAQDRLRLVMGFAMQQFFFDPAGNIVDKPGEETDAMVPVVSGRSTPVKGYQVRTLGGSRFDYDDVGNLIQQHGEQSARYSYNDQNLMSKAVVQDQVFEYFYDAFGRRIKKKDAFGETEYLWDGDVLLAEQRNRFNVTYVHEPGTFIPLCQIRDKRIYYYHNDHMGTPQLMTDKNGVVVWDALYRVQGGIAKYKNDFVDNPIRFQGQYMDSETGLHYNRNRYYHPELGRFTNQDPVGLLGGENSYQYAPNPLRWVDPLGLSCRDVTEPLPFVYNIPRPDGQSAVPLPNPVKPAAVFRGGSDKNTMFQIWRWSLKQALGKPYAHFYRIRAWLRQIN